MKGIFCFSQKIKYENIVSLGYNCEVSFYIQKYCGKLNSCLFSWAYVYGIEFLLKALNDWFKIFREFEIKERLFNG